MLVTPEPKLEQAIFKAAYMHVLARLFHAVHLRPEDLVHLVNDRRLKRLHAEIRWRFLKNLVACLADESGSASAGLVLKQCVRP